MFCCITIDGGTPPAFYRLPKLTSKKYHVMLVKPLSVTVIGDNEVSRSLFGTIGDNYIFVMNKAFTKSETFLVYNRSAYAELLAQLVRLREEKKGRMIRKRKMSKN